MGTIMAIVGGLITGACSCDMLYRKPILSRRKSLLLATIGVIVLTAGILINIKK
jgi:hypothetical protein